MTEPSRNELVPTAPARRPRAERLPEAVASAAIDFLTTVLVSRRHQVGKRPRDQFVGASSARRGTYRVQYRLREDPPEVIVLRIEYRRDVYRPH